MRLVNGIAFQAVIASHIDWFHHVRPVSWEPPYKATSSFPRSSTLCIFYSELVPLIPFATDCTFAQPQFAHFLDMLRESEMPPGR